MEYVQEYLKYIYHEDVYLIDEPSVGASSTDTGEEAREIPDAPPEQQVNEPSPVKYLGSNNKGILILVNDRESEFLNEKDLGFLMRIIESGVKYSKTDIAVVNCIKFPYWQIFDEVHHAFLIAFGNHHAEFLLGKPKYQLLENEGIKVLIADDLYLIEDDKEKKTQLWKALQRMFNLN